jgi:hypothetical protein
VKTVDSEWKPRTYGRELSGGIYLTVDSHIGDSKWSWRVFRVDSNSFSLTPRDTLAKGDADTLEAGIEMADAVAKAMGFA